jgi:hypothetical protein
MEIMIEVKVYSEPDKTEEQIVDEDLRQFSEFFEQELDNSGGLSKPERSLLKTYLYWKTHPGEKTDGSQEDGGGAV